MLNSRLSRVVEFILLFFVLPILIFFDPVGVPKIPILLLATAYVVFALRADRSFDNKLFWNYSGFRKGYKWVLLRMAIVCLLNIFIAVLFWRVLLFNFMLDHFWFWLLVMFLYPLLSAYPQELIYRVFFFHRYRILFGKPVVMVLMSAVAFAFLHVIYKNWIAVMYTFVGGLIFSVNYFRNRSAAGVGIEHAVYGDLLFTLGLGGFFYNG